MCVSTNSLLKVNLRSYRRFVNGITITRRSKSNVYINQVSTREQLINGPGCDQQKGKRDATENGKLKSTHES